MKRAMIRIEANFGSELEKYSIVVIMLKATGSQYMFEQKKRQSPTRLQTARLY